MRAWYLFVLRHRWLVLGLCALLTGLALIPISQAVVATSFLELFLGESPEYEVYKKRARQFANDESFVIVYETRDPFSEEGRARIARVAGRVRALPDVRRVISLQDARKISFEEGRPIVAPHATLEELLEDPLYCGMLISKDGRWAVLYVEMELDPERAYDRAPELLRETLAVFEEEGYPPGSLLPGGLVAMVGEITYQTEYNLRTLFPLVVVVLVVIVLALFRRLAPVIVSVGVSLLGVLWCIGFATLLDPQLNVLISIVPTVVLVVAISDVIHLWSAYLNEVDRGLDRQEAIVTSASEVGKACLWTSATTFTGFLCLSLVPTPIFRIMGLALGMGVAVSLLLAMTLVPIVLSFLKTPRGTGRRRSWRGISGVLNLSSRLSTKHPRLVILAFALLVVVAGIGIWRLEIETDFHRRLSPDNEYLKNQHFIMERFSGMNTLDVYIKLLPSQDMMDPDLTVKAAEIRDRVQELPLVDRALSLLDVVEALRGAGATEEEIRGLFMLYALSGRDELKGAMDLKTRTFRIHVRLNGYGVRETKQAGDEIVRITREVLQERADVEVTGLTYVLGSWLDNFLAGQRRGMAVSFSVIAILMIVAFRSFRVGILSMIPNLFPLIVLVGYVGLFWDQVDSDIMMVVVMAIGIGVDDTIHFMMRYRLESQKTPDRTEALQRTFDFAGRAIIMTTVILALGFLPLALSEYFTLHMMGTLLPSAFVIALAADLLLVPAFASVGWMGFRPKRD